jgi:hypothetical protein
MEPTELKPETIWNAFRGLRCAGCGGVKRAHNAFCLRCYYRLPRALKQSLFQRFGEGFEEAYRVCIAWFPVHPVETKERKRA